MACTNCAAACKRCDEARPCERCKKYGVADTCVDGQRKERKKGIKRGPYKRKTKPSAEDKPEDTSQPSEGGDWPQGSPTPPSTTPAPSAAPQPTVQFPPEGFYPIYIPPGYPLPDLQSSADGSASTVAPALVPIYIGGFAPYGYPPGAIFQFPPAGTHPPPPPASQAPTTEAGTVPAVGKGSEASIEATSRGSSGTAAEVSTTKDDQDEAKSDENTKVPSAAAAAGPVTND
ncbi:hypothetical protein GYMLUDRAFT_727679 [Collybiopsis luxurians FD-317 M1]|nr:hypothetical protein GYMLUDRAFT_727679 [Collybiopsis luxurians FD-317 M1]